MPKIVAISTKNVNEYVYDLSSAAGTFCIENGVVLKNTDSVYVRWKGVDMHKAFLIFGEKDFRHVVECE